jgi:aminoglycoside phosphotransferase (APT) family kinase protein
MMAELIGALMPDPLVRGVGRLLAERGPKRFVKELAHTLPVGGSVRLVVVKQRPGQRVVLRIDAVRGGVEHSWYAKLLRGLSGGDPERLRRMSELATRAAAEGVRIPSPCAYLRRYRAIVFETLGGAPLVACGLRAGGADDPAAAGADRPAGDAQILRRVGSVLAKLHDLPPPRDRVEARAFELGRIERLRQGIMVHRADLAVEFEQALVALAVPRDSDSSRAASMGTIHGDLHPLQIFVPSASDDPVTEVVILDWDAACLGDAERDLGNMVAHLELERELGHVSPDVAREWTGSLLAGFRDVREYDPALFQWYRRASLLRLAALHSNPSFGHSPPNPVRLAPALIRAAGLHPQHGSEAGTARR